MSLQFFNTLTRSKEEFVPLSPPQVRLYTCGPTVYNFAHIGNFRTFVFEDLLRRYLEYRGYRVTHVMNITDVEDKIIRSVRETGETLPQLTSRYTQAFLDDLKTLNCKPAHHLPRATECVAEIIALIGTLMDKGVAYRADDGSVYFSIKKFPQYGKLARLKMEELKLGARVSHDEYAKESLSDFALWKAWNEKDGDVAWDSPWGRGRPGWHIECSAMSMKLLGESFDLHCGGEDLIFPHHEDEIAQSEAATGKPFVKYWLHSAHLMVNGEKMSKSAGNFYTLRDLLTKGWTGREVRYALASVHYRLPLNFTMDGLEGARSSLGRIDELRLKLKELTSTVAPTEGGADVDRAVKGFEEALDDDLNIAAALGVLFEFVRDTNKRLDSRSVSPQEAAAMLGAWERFDSVLGVGPATAAEVPLEIQRLVEERQGARKSKNFKRADEIRAELTRLGWVLEDTAQGARVKRG
jgi:cysteinyl-tRNA synthetase